MKNLTISQLKAEATDSPLTCEIDVQVQNIITKTTKGGKPYKEFILADGGGQLTLKLWENLPQFDEVSHLSEHAFLRLSGDWTQNQYGIEGIRWQFRELNSQEASEFLAGDSATALTQQKDWNDILEMTGSIADPRLHGICQLFLKEFGDKFRRTAAARRNHHARRGGLVEHVAQMMRCAHAICSVYPKLNRDLLTAGVLFHDCGKLWENSYPEAGFTQSYQLAGEMLGHIPLGIEITNKLWHKLLEDSLATPWLELSPSNEEVRLHLLHLIASHHGTHEFGSPTLPRTPEAYALHHIDNIDAKYEMFQMGYQSGQELAPNIIERQFPLPTNLITPLEHITPAVQAIPPTSVKTSQQQPASPPAQQHPNSNGTPSSPEPSTQKTNSANQTPPQEGNFFGSELF